MSNLIFIILFVTVICVAFIKKIDCYQIIIDGTKEAFTCSINLFSTLFTFMLALTLFQNCGITEYLEEVINFDYIDIVLQMIIRPLSSSSSYTILLDIIKEEGVDSLKSMLATIIHFASDSSIYLITIYTQFTNVKLSKKVYIFGYILNILSYLIGICLILFFYVIFN